jgi:hypothetical protein
MNEPALTCSHSLYIHIRGASALLVSADRAMREPQLVERVTELAPRFFMYMVKDKLILLRSPAETYKGLMPYYIIYYGKEPST